MKKNDGFCKIYFYRKIKKFNKAIKNTLRSQDSSEVITTVRGGLASIEHCVRGGKAAARNKNLK